MEFSNKIILYKHKLDLLEKLIKTLSVESVLNRGFAIVEKESCVMVSSKQANIGDKIKIRMKDGNLISTVDDIEGDNNEQ